MSVTKAKTNITDILEEMIRCGEGMIAAARALQKICLTAGEVQQPAETSTEIPTGPAAEVTSAEEVKAEPAKTCTKEDVRCILSARSADGFSKEVKTLLGKYGADRLSALKPEHYEAVIKEAEVIGRG